MRVFIIAEAGVNHNGSLEIAKRLVDAAKHAGADCIKFQTYQTEKLVSLHARKADYQLNNTRNVESQFTMLKNLELSYDDFRKIKQYCEKVEIVFLSTPFDLESVEFLDQVGVALWKIPSGEITNLPFLEKIATTEKPVLLSTGMCSLDEIDSAIAILRKKGSTQISLLHCTTEYPAPFEEVNLRAMQTIKARFGGQVGYSDHTTGIEISVAAVALGAEIIEKHFTLDRTMNGPDHKASLDPQELKQMVSQIRHVEVALGDGVKIPTASELKNLLVARKSIVAKKDIKLGEVLTERNITVKRPGNGINPMLWYEILGTTANRAYQRDELIER